MDLFKIPLFFPKYPTCHFPFMSTQFLGQFLSVWYFHCGLRSAGIIVSFDLHGIPCVKPSKNFERSCKRATARRGASTHYPLAVHPCQATFLFSNAVTHTFLVIGFQTNNSFTLLVFLTILNLFLFRDVLPFTLKLPEAIASARTAADLEEVAKLGAGLFSNFFLWGTGGVCEPMPGCKWSMKWFVDYIVRKQRHTNSHASYWERFILFPDENYHKIGWYFAHVY